MPHTSASVPAFYQADGPPEPLPLLTYHTELLCPTASIVLISPQEEIAFSTLRGRARTPSRIFTTTTSFRAARPSPSRPSTPTVTKAVSFLSEPDQLSMYSSMTSMESNASKIPKPEGEAGRPGRGGYNLENALHWDAHRFKLFKESLHRYIDKHCDTRKSKTHQTPTALMSVQNDAIAHFPELHDYQDNWPVGDIIQMQLKNLSAKERQKKNK